MERGAAAVIFDASGRLLLVRENYGQRRYGFPGGSVNPGETPHQAVVREVREETGTNAEIDYLVGVYRLVSGFEAWLFRCHIGGDVPQRPPSDEIAAVGWFPLDAIPTPITNVLHHALADVRRGRRDVVRDDLAVLS